MTPDYEYVLKYGDPRVAVYPLMDSPTTMLFIIAIYFIFVKYVGPTWMKNRPPYSFRSVMIVYNLSISAFNMWLFINFGVYGWFTKYKLRCEPVDFSSNDDALKMVQLCWLFFASRFLEFADTIFAVLRKKDSFVSKIHLFHHCIAPVISWNSANYGPGGYNTNLMFIVSFMHTWLYLYYFLSVKTEGRPWGKTYITLMQVISLFITCLYYFQLYFFAPDSCKLSPYLLRINLGARRMDFFGAIGSFGRWQLRAFLLFACLNVVGMWQNFSIVFLAPNMDFHCVQPPPPPSPHHRGAERCWVPLHPNSSALEPCTRWEYDTSKTSHTIVSEWNLVCDREWLVSLAKSIYMVGFLCSVFVFGHISDSVGRYPTILVCYVITCVSMFLSLLSGSFTLFIVLRFLQAFGRAGATTVGYVLIMEMVGPQHQTEVGIAIQLGWAVGYVTLVGVAWFFRHWFWLQLVISLSFLPFALFFSFIPESPRWLLTQGKTKKLEKLLIKAAAVNKREVSEDIKKLISLRNLSEKEVKQTASMLEVLKVPEMRNRAFEMIYLWFLNAFLYYALSYNTNDLAGDPYLNFFVSGFIEFPSYALVFWGIKSWGRRPTLISCMAAGGMACAAILLVPSDTAWLSTTFAMVGKFCVTGSFGILYLYTTEVFPTSVRNATLGSCSMCARVGSILAPFVRDLGKATHETVPNVLYAFLALSGSLVTLLLPETRGLDLPDTLQEAADMGRPCRKGSAMESTPLTKQ